MLRTPSELPTRPQGTRQPLRPPWIPVHPRRPDPHHTAPQPRHTSDHRPADGRDRPSRHPGGQPAPPPMPDEEDHVTDRPAARVFVTPFAGERPYAYTVASDRAGVKLRGLPCPPYVDEHGITWEPWGGEQTGNQRHEEHHPTRQRACVKQRLCGGCGQESDEHPQFGRLWVLPDAPAGWPCEISTTAPPFCLLCARRAVRDCQGLGDDFVRVRAPVARVTGVAGTLHLPGRDPEDRIVPIADGLRRHMVARQLVLTLEGALLDPAPLYEPAHVGLGS